MLHKSISALEFPPETIENSMVERQIDKVVASAKSAFSTVQEFNEICPFGNRSTKHCSNNGRAPDIKQAGEANKAIGHILKAFVQKMQSDCRAVISSKNMTINEYFAFATQCSHIHNHMPSSIEEVVPISRSRNGEDIIGNLEKSAMPLIEFLCEKHHQLYQIEGSHLMASRKNMSALSKLLRTKDSTLLYEKVLLEELAVKNNNMKIGESEEDLSIIISCSLQKALIEYQSIQERFESAMQIDEVNNLLAERKDILEAIVQVQLKICDSLQKQIQEMPTMLHHSIAFSEIATIQEDGSVLPSTRFLKIITHNWSRYFIEKPFLSSSEILRYAADRAMEDNLYFQNIFIFNTVNGEIVLRGIAPKVCPARNVVGPMFNLFL